MPAADGTVWWVQRWTHPEMDGESNEVLRSYRLKRGRVVETGTLHTAQATGGRVVARTTTEPLAHRDLDGDGDLEKLIPCDYGKVCVEGVAREAIMPSR